MAKEKEAPPENQGGKKKKGKLFLIVAVIIVLAIVGVGAKMFLLSGSKKTARQRVSTATQQQASEEAPPPSSPSYTPAYPASLTPVVIGPIIVNLADVGGDRYLKIKLVLLEAKGVATQAKKEKEKTGFSLEDAVIRDTIITVLSSKTSDDLLSVSGKEELKNELISAINQALHKNLVRKVYFLTFIIQ